MCSGAIVASPFSYCFHLFISSFCFAILGTVLFYLGLLVALLCFPGTLEFDLKLVEVRSIPNFHMTSLSVLFGGFLTVEN